MTPLLFALLIDLHPIITGLDKPVQIVSAHDQTGDLYVAEQSGRILRINVQSGLRQTFLDLRNRVSCCDNGGLLSIAFHPQYAVNGKLFVQYVDANGDTAIARFTRSDINSAVLLLVAPQPKDNVPNHHGGTLRFGPDGFLYISIGDGGAFRQVTGRAQELHHLLGKLLRIDVDRGSPYAIPPDNPFAGQPGARGEIWSYGLRNPWRFSFDPASGDLFIADVGQDSWEEIDIISFARSRGANFGWPLMEASHCYPPGSSCSSAGLELPALEYPRDLGCSVTGGHLDRGVYFYGDWCSGRLWTATRTPSGWTSSIAADTDKAIVSIDEADSGELYVVDYAGGKVSQLSMPIVRRRTVRQ